MANTLVMMMAILGLILDTFLAFILAMYSNLILSPIYSIFELLTAGPQPLDVSQVSYIPMALWTIILLMWITCAITFIVTVSRRGEVGYDESI
jgi:hypothetical protein